MPPQDQIVAYDFSRLQVLLVEDCAPMRKLFKNVLHALGMKRIVGAKDGTDALQALDGYFADVIFVDQEMAPMNGTDFVREVRAGTDGINPFTPVIMVSGHTEVSRILAARDAGVTEYLAKPISAKLVLSRLRSVVENPRPFIRTEEFFGPDRRRRQLPFDQADRRKKPHEYLGPFRQNTR